MKTILITGASERIGAALGLSFLAQGYRVLLHSRQWTPEKKSVFLATPSDLPPIFLEADMSLTSGRQDLVAQVKKQGSLDGILHNASRFDRTPLKTLSEDDWLAYWNLHVTIPLFLTRDLTPLLEKSSEKPFVIFMGDRFTHYPYRDHLPYCVSKEASLSLVRSLAVELAPKVRVNAVSLGFMLPSESDSQQPEMVRRLSEKNLLGHAGGVEPVIKAVHSLVENEYMTGSNLVVDGGFDLV